MLNKRTNILLDDEIYAFIADQAKRQNISMGAYIRQIARKEQNSLEEDRLVEQRTESFRAIKRLRARIKPLPKGVTIRDLIEDGRKY